jgi:hypothetical protein
LFLLLLLLFFFLSPVGSAASAPAKPIGEPPKGRANFAKRPSGPDGNQDRRDRSRWGPATLAASRGEGKGKVRKGSEKEGNYCHRGLGARGAAAIKW